MTGVGRSLGGVVSCEGKQETGRGCITADTLNLSMPLGYESAPHSDEEIELKEV